MTCLLPLALILITAAIAWLGWEAATAPEGWEDDEGWHHGPWDGDA